jgi:hypothetical protein
MEMLRIYDVDDLRSLPAGLWGIREPDRLRPNGMDLREDGTPALILFSFLLHRQVTLCVAEATF